MENENECVEERITVETLGDLEKGKYPLYVQCQSCWRIARLNIAPLIFKYGREAKIPKTAGTCSNCGGIGKTFIGSPLDGRN